MRWRLGEGGRERRAESGERRSGGVDAVDAVDAVDEMDAMDAMDGTRTDTDGHGRTRTEHGQT